jgi:anthranilate synthase
MTVYKKIQYGLVEGVHEIPCQPANKLFQGIYQDYKYKFLFESKDISPIYGRLSLLGVDPALRITGKDDHFEIEALNARGKYFLKQINKEDLQICDSYKETASKIFGKIKCVHTNCEESQRSKQKNISQIIRSILGKFKLEDRSYLGLYGAFSYDFVRLFEDISEKNPENEVNDFDLFLYDTFIFFDHLKDRSEIIVFRQSKKEAEAAVKALLKKITKKQEKEINYSITGAKLSLSKKEYKKLVKTAQKYSKEGELFEVVFANILKAHFAGEPYALYLKYSEVNPSPYLFFFDFGEEQLVGASPEMMVRVEHGQVHMRPISGTARRGNDPIEDHENMLGLLSDSKERAELDMLIDLGRNDLSRVCKPGVEISDYRFVEKYSRVMHTVTHLTGELNEDCTALDALIACLNAGTLTGTPKVAAMNAIERHEKERRGFYGGVIGYLTFSGEMDSGIIIRTAHIQGEKLRFQVGATLLYRSVPEKEFQETIHKAQAFIDTFANPMKS